LAEGEERSGLRSVGRGAEEGGGWLGLVGAAEEGGRVGWALLLLLLLLVVLGRGAEEGGCALVGGVVGGRT